MCKCGHSHRKHNCPTGVEKEYKEIVLWRNIMKEMAVLRGNDRIAVTQFSDTFECGTFHEKCIEGPKCIRDPC